MGPKKRDAAGSADCDHLGIPELSGATVPVGWGDCREVAIFCDRAGAAFATSARPICDVQDHLGTRPFTEVHKWLAEVTPVRGDDEKQAAESERGARDDPSRGASLQRRDFGGDEPDTGEQDKQEPHFGDDHPGVRRESSG